ncbi:TetR/AcrR family transcriptional regulator [Aneurinibacillus tyrosinisolvens]|uniref:TetR/AcrR family transcriptional regulator n=1 Tax=Aneurinibacillus tyrosinisolvens TaxID=1443435 RepID=UPI00069AC3D1|nr:TetR/AcrR family transcriptional regulator [Aneurinibacillus tyrosinisolvens]
MEKKYSPRVKRTRDKILDSAVQVFSQKGFQASTIREIARSAGVNDLTVYRHFESKEKLFNEMFRQHTLLSEMNNFINSRVKGDFNADIRAIITMFVSTFKREIALVKLILIESENMIECRKYLASFTGTIIKDLTAFFIHYQESGVIRPEANCYAIASSLYSTVFARVYSLILYGDVREEQDWISEEELIEGWIDMYRASATNVQYVH